MSNVHKEPDEIEVRYTPAMVRGAVRTFVRSRLDRRIMAAIVVLAATIPVWTQTGRLPAIYAMVTAFLVGFGLLIWLTQHILKMRTLCRMGPPVASVRMRAEGLYFRSDADTGEVPFTLIDTVLRRSDCLILVTGPGRFTVLPTAGLSEAWKSAPLERVTGASTPLQGRKR